MMIRRCILAAAWIGLPIAGACSDPTIEATGRQGGATRAPASAATPVPSESAAQSPSPTPHPGQSSLAGHAEQATPDPTPSSTPRVARSVLLTPQSAALNLPAAAGAASVGLPATSQFTAFVFYGDGTSDSDVTWTILGDAATVSATGLVSAVATGTCVLAAAARSDLARSATASVTVRADGTLGLTLD